MSRMNWDRLQSRDRMRGGRSDAEMAEDRDDAWFQREMERESLRGVGRYGRGRAPAPPARRSGKPKTKTTKKKPQGSGPKEATGPKPRKPRSAAVKMPVGAKKKRPAPKVDELAERLGITAAEITDARRNDATASTGLGGMTKSERRERAAARLGITKRELEMVRSALAGSVDPAEAVRVCMLIQTVASRTGLANSKAAVTSAADTTKSRSRKPTERKRVRSSKQATDPVKAKKGRAGEREATVFVTMWGNVAHLHHDCHSARGFRHAQEPDPLIYRVPVKDPSCRGRRVCGTCKRMDGRKGEKVEQELRRMHGAAFDERDWERHGWSRPKPQGQPINSKTGR